MSLYSFWYSNKLQLDSRPVLLHLMSLVNPKVKAASKYVDVPVSENTVHISIFVVCVYVWKWMYDYLSMYLCMGDFFFFFKIWIILTEYTNIRCRMTCFYLFLCTHILPCFSSSIFSTCPDGCLSLQMSIHSNGYGQKQPATHAMQPFLQHHIVRGFCVV